MSSGIGRLNHATQTGRHSAVGRGRELHPTPTSAIETLLDVGRGAIVNAMRARGHTVIASDVFAYGDLKLDFVGDFLKAIRAPAGCTAIIDPNFLFAMLDDFAAFRKPAADFDNVGDHALAERADRRRVLGKQVGRLTRGLKVGIWLLVDVAHRQPLLWLIVGVPGPSSHAWSGAPPTPLSVIAQRRTETPRESDQRSRRRL